MVYVQPSYDAGIFITQIIIGFACLVLYRKIGALLLVVSIMCFLVGGLIIVTGNDVSSYTQTVTSAGIINQTTWFIGNGQFQTSGSGQLWMGYGLIVLAAVTGVIFLDQTVRGNLITGNGAGS